MFLIGGCAQNCDVENNCANFIKWRTFHQCSHDVHSQSEMVLEAAMIHMKLKVVKHL